MIKFQSENDCYLMSTSEACYHQWSVLVSGAPSSPATFIIELNRKKARGCSTKYNVLIPLVLTLLPCQYLTTLLPIPVHFLQSNGQDRFHVPFTFTYLTLFSVSTAISPLNSTRYINRFRLESILIAHCYLATTFRST